MSKASVYRWGGRTLVRPVCQPGNDGIQEFDVFGSELAAAVLLPLGMNRYAENMLPIATALEAIAELGVTAVTSSADTRYCCYYFPMSTPDGPERSRGDRAQGVLGAVTNERDRLLKQIEAARPPAAG